MRPTIILTLAACPLIALLAVAADHQRGDNPSVLPTQEAIRQSDAPAEYPGVAVVELFTSESCSSCPPAERLLNTIDAQAEDTGLPVYALAFHVDYWNYLHWEDRFSSAAYTQRQRDYARRVFNTQRVYTPQMIVNGRTGFVGHNQRAAKEAVQAALAQPIRVQLAPVVQIQPDNRTIKVQVTSSTPWSGVLNAALTEDGLTTRVTGGENTGRSLVHRAVVRGFARLSIEPNQRDGDQASGSSASVHRFELPLPADLNPEAASVVVFAQDPRDGSVLGAAAVPLD